MFDELQRLRDDERLAWLLHHYADGNALDREAWQDRLMACDDLGPDELVKLHGELLAYEWIEQNGNATPEEGQLRRCYRVTSAGRRALRQLTLPSDENTPLAA